MTHPFGPIGMVVVQSTSLCNLDCDYCYLPDRQKRRVFDLAQVPLLVQRIVESPYCGPELAWVWHAGEPLTLPCAYYDQASVLIQEALAASAPAGGIAIEQHIQTNGTLINDQWCEYFRRNQIVVGVSLDGPEALHDQHRRFHSGRGSHALTMRGIEALQRHGIPFHVIAVLTAEAMDDPEGVYAFFRDHQIKAVGFNVEEQEGVHGSSSMQGIEQEDSYYTFLETFWQLSERDGFPVVLREFEHLLGLMETRCRLTDNELTRPFSILSVDWEGHFSTFDPELLSVSAGQYGDFNLGNLATTSLAEAAASDRFRRLWDDQQAGVQLCESSCDYFGLCGGGMGSNKFWEHGTLACSETSACRFKTQIPARVLLDWFESRSAGMNQQVA